ncbi:flavin monoamine oxidase family protein [Inhella sp.]|uniref:flavin monoamine oxidase family protein n=1 Tax=Inhella sp. TaxID=1921806 RepID=UPI0035AFFEC9
MLTRRAALTLPLLAACTQKARELEGGWLGPDPALAHRLREPLPDARTVKQRRAQVLVLGGGVAGLVCARQLRAAGVEVALLELDQRVGGHSRGAELAGQPVPLGAHYLPQPGPEAPELQDLLVELGAATRMQGRWQAVEAYQCHAPAERLFHRGAWLPGLLPPAADEAAQAQRRRFAAAVRAAQQLGFALPSTRAPWTDGHRALDAQSFAQWLQAQGLDEPDLRTYLDYCCRDDYGAGLARVSAWAGLHYFASRHGFAASAEEAHEQPVLTWPQGNAWLVERLAAPLTEAIHRQRLALAVNEEREGVSVLAQGPEGLEQWQAHQVVLATPLFIARRLLRRPDAALDTLQLPRAPWLIANLRLDGPLLQRRGAPPAWDNVIHGSAALGYVDARHQSLDPRPGPTVLTAYWALPEARRAELLSRPWRDWLAELLAHYTGVHPDLPERLMEARLTRWGHAMAIPAPGVRGQAALAALRQGRGRLAFAHSDLAGYSVFEEAFEAGRAAAEGLLTRPARAR